MLIKPPDKKFRKELNAGTAALVLLGILERRGEPMYGYQLAKIISPAGGPAPMMKQGALYPVLRSLERDGLLESTVETSVSGPPRRYYSITAAGRETLARWIEMWKGSRDFVDSILRGVHDE